MWKAVCSALPMLLSGERQRMLMQRLDEVRTPRPTTGHGGGE